MKEEKNERKIMRQTYLAWDLGELQPILQNHDVHIWCADLNIPDDLLQQLFRLLNHAEKERAARYIRTVDRSHFIAARSILRDILSRYCHCAAENIQFNYNAKGKPFLNFELMKFNIHFNLSHSHGVALYAISHCENIGIDIEYNQRQIHPLEIAQRFFSKEEIALLSHLPKSEQLTNFYKIWTRKEAYVKAIGEGISNTLDQFSVDLINFKSKIKSSTTNGKLSDWYIYDILMDPNYTATLALSFDEPIIRYLRWHK